MISRRKLLAGAASVALATEASDASGGFLRGGVGFFPSATFQFTIASTSTTSAGVFDSNGVLVRTLWSNIQYAPGTYTAAWDGTLDIGAVANGTTIPVSPSIASTGAYTIKVISSQVTYTWEGMVGNTSNSWTDSTTLHAEDIMFGMAITSSYIYYCTGYNESRCATFKAVITTPESKIAILPTVFHFTGAVTEFVATDGTYVYWSGFDGFAPNNNFVYATKTIDDTEVSFSSGTIITITNGPTYNNVIDQVVSVGALITGLAVQTAGSSYLCVARKALNTIDVLNKTTGALAQSNTITAPGALVCDSASGLWVIQGTQINQYTVNSGGTLTATGLSITGLVNPLAITISPDGTTILVADGGTSQQVKAFSSTTAASTWTYGVAGGYATGPASALNKFYFHDFANNTKNGGQDWTYLAYQPDGTFWVGDSGNCRSLYFTAGPSPTFILTVMWLPTCYSVFVDPNNNTRVFANALEFNINYSISLGPYNGSWSLVNNWGYKLIPPFTSPTYYDAFGVLRNVATLSNGRTYAQVRGGTNLNVYQIIELDPVNGVRFTGITTPTLSYAQGADGSWYSVAGNPNVFSRTPLTGFDGSNNPLYGPLTTVATSPTLVPGGPGWYAGGAEPGVVWAATPSNIIPVFDARLPSITGDPVTHTGFHLGGVNIASGAWQWKASPSTDSNYLGGWPNDGAFDIGNHALAGGSTVSVLGHNVFYQYYGEGWKSGEVNQWAHFYDDGLMVGRFGVVQDQSNPGQEAEGQPGMAGNAFTNTVVQGPSTAAYVYHNDESFHGGVHRWRIDNLPTISEQSTAISWNSWQYSAVIPTDLLTGLPYSASVTSGTANWTYNPTTQVTTSPSTNYWTIITNVLNYNPSQSPDIQISFCQASTASPPPPYTVTRSLSGTSVSTTSWTLTAMVSWTRENNDNGGTNDGLHFDIVDGAGKVIARVDPVQVTSNTTYRLLVNGATLLSFSGTAAAFRAIINAPTLLTISASGGNITFTYGVNGPTTVAPFDGTSVWNEATNLVITGFCIISAGYFNHTIDLQTLNFSHVP